MEMDTEYQSDATVSGDRARAPHAQATTKVRHAAHTPLASELAGEDFVGSCGQCGEVREYHCARCGVCFCEVCDDERECVECVQCDDA